MNQLNTTGHQVWHVEELVCCTTRERLPFPVSAPHDRA